MSKPGGGVVASRLACPMLDGVEAGAAEAALFRTAFLPCDIILQHRSVRDWSVHPDWQVTSQHLPGSHRFAADHPTRLILPRWIDWRGARYFYDEERSTTPSSHTDDAHPPPSAATSSSASKAKRKKQETTKERTFEICGAWGVILFYSLYEGDVSSPPVQRPSTSVLTSHRVDVMTSPLPRVLALKMCHRHERQLVELRMQARIQEWLQSVQPSSLRNSFAESFLLPLAVQYGDALIEPGVTNHRPHRRPSMFPHFLLDPETHLPKRRPISFTLFEAMDMDLYTSCILSSTPAFDPSPTRPVHLAATLAQLRPMKQTIVRAMIKSLHFLHRRGMVHADVKLENFLIDAKPAHRTVALTPAHARAPTDAAVATPTATVETVRVRVKLCDFDTAVGVGFAGPHADPLGTLDCYSPERLKDYQALATLGQQLARVTTEYRAQQAQCPTNNAVTMKLWQQREQLKTEYNAKRDMPVLPWRTGDDVWSVALVILSVLTETVWENSMFPTHLVQSDGTVDPKAGNVWRNTIQHHLTTTSRLWLDAFPGESVESMTTALYEMSQPRSSRRVLIPLFFRKKADTRTTGPVASAGAAVSAAAASKVPACVAMKVTVVSETATHRSRQSPQPLPAQHAQKHDTRDVQDSRPKKAHKRFVAQSASSAASSAESSSSACESESNSSSSCSASASSVPARRAIIHQATRAELKRQRPPGVQPTASLPDDADVVSQVLLRTTPNDASCLDGSADSDAVDDCDTDAS